MNRLISRSCVAVLALLGSTLYAALGSAATVTVTPSVANPVALGAFNVIVSGDAGFPVTTGATLGVTFDPAVISIGTADFIDPNFNFAVYTPVSAGNGLVSVISTSALGVGGPFQAFQLNLTAIGAGNANLVFVDDGIDLGWSDVTAQNYQGVVYNQAAITVAAVATAPNIVVTDSVPPPDDLLVPFGNITLNTTSPQTVTVTNSGDADLVLGQVAGLAAPFSLAADNCSGQTLAPLASCTIQVQFQPVAAGLLSDTLDIPSNDPDTATVNVAVNGTGTALTAPNIAVTDSVAPADDLNIPFGDITLNTTSPQTVTVTNSGNAALNVGQVVSPAAPFSLGTDNCSNQSLAALASCTIQVRFSPVAAGPFSGTLNIPSDDPDTATVTVNVGGNGVAPPVPNIAVTDSVAPVNDLLVPFGGVTIGGAGAPQTVTVTNSGNASLVLGQVSTPVAPFSLGTDNCSNQTLAALATCTIQVQFQPVAVGVFTGSINIPSNDPDTATVAVSLSGTGASSNVADITVTDSVPPADDLQVDFSNVRIFAAAEKTVTVTNDGSQDLVIGTIGGANPLLAPFSIVTDTDRCSGQTLAPAESCTILLVFAPDLINVYNDSFDIPSNDPDEPTVTVAVSGTGIKISDSGGSSVDPLSLMLLAGLPLLRRRRR